MQDIAKILQDNNGKSCPVLHISSCLQNVLCDRTQTGHCPESSLMMINESDPVYARRQHHPATQVQSRCGERGIILTLWEPKYECGTDCQNIDFSHEKLAANLRAAHAIYKCQNSQNSAYECSKDQ